MHDNSKSIREWALCSNPEKTDYILFQRTRVTDERPPMAVVDRIAVDREGVDVFTNVEATGEALIASPVQPDVVLAAIFRQVGIVDDLRTLLSLASVYGEGEAGARIRKAFGEALS